MKLALHLRADGATEPHDTALRKKQEQVLHNLLGNAVRYSSPDSSIEVRAVHEDRCGLVSVADRGDGIPEGEEERI